MDKVLRTIKKLIPKKLFSLGQPLYHYALTLTGALIYGFPANKIKIIGVTGTKGKSTSVEILNSIFEHAGYKTAISGTIRFKIGNEECPNKYKMSMPGRFFMQKFLRDAVDAKCDVAIIEMTSEGSKQFRHKFIYLDALIFTNLSPEHIESHGSFEKYKQAKLNIVDNLRKKKGLLVVNGDSPYTKEFADYYGTPFVSFSTSEHANIKSRTPVSFDYHDMHIDSPLVGEFNIQNIIGAYHVGNHFKIPQDKILEGIARLAEVKGRAQFIPNTKSIDIVVDYAHTPDSLEAIYKAFDGKKRICVLGNTGGGRDTWKRPAMAKIANTYCDEVILTDEDPYDEDPIQIINEMKGSIDSHKLEIELDRKTAIAKAIQKASPGDAVLITGKGTDPYIMRANGAKEAWSDAGIVEEILNEVR